MGKKKFFKKSDDVRHFRLMSRSMHDANADDPNATPLVLEAFVPPNKLRKPGAADELMEIPETLQTLGPAVFGRGEQQPEADHLLDDDLDGSDDDDDEDEDQVAIERRLADLDGDLLSPRRAEPPESTIGGETTCIVCMANPKTHFAAPCGHHCACGSCAEQMKQCPCCREPVVMWMERSSIRTM